MSTTQRPEKPKSAAQRAAEANRAQQIAVNAKGSRPSDRRNTKDGEASDQGLENDQRPVGIGRKS
jgi:hypothetical protein